MKNLAFILLISILAFSCTSKQNNSTDKATSVAVAANKTINLSIEGMSCTGCENTIKEAVGAVKGVTEVTASYQTGEAVVKFDSTQTNLKSISDAITEAGYTVKGESQPTGTPPSGE